MNICPSNMHDLFNYKGFTISHRTYGSGDEVILAFHGFGLDGSMFKEFAGSLSSRFSMVCVDVVHHGFSSFPEDRGYSEPLEASELVAIHHALMDELKVDTFWIAGYSMGGRLALGMIEQDASRCNGVILLAPDGLVRRPWYRGLAHSRIGHRLYDHWVEKPALFNWLTKVALRFHLIDERLYTFLMEHSASYDTRSLVRAIWFTLRRIEPDLQVVADNVRKRQLDLYLFLGKHDSIIRPSHSKYLLSLLGDRCELHLLNAGHAIILARTGSLVLEKLAKEKGPKPLQ